MLPFFLYMPYFIRFLRVFAVQISKRVLTSTNLDSPQLTLKYAPFCVPRLLEMCPLI